MLYIRQNQFLNGLCPTILWYTINHPPKNNNTPNLSNKEYNTTKNHPYE